MVYKVLCVNAHICAKAGVLMTQKTKWLLTALVVIAIGALAVILVKAPAAPGPGGDHSPSTEETALSTEEV